jgi:hypothetical protein
MAQRMVELNLLKGNVMLGELSTKQQKALDCLLVSPTHEAAATSAGITTVTLWRYLKDETFRDAFRDARREAVSLAVSQLQRASNQAVDTLLNVANDADAAPGARVSAAKTILEMSLKGVELEDLAARIEFLEGVIETKPELRK